METFEKITEPRLWQDNGWTANIIKNDDDDGWAVAMTPHGQSEPALIGPWTMGRDKKNPKPLDPSAFITLVKTASEFVSRQNQQRHASLHQQIEITHAERRISVSLDIEPDDDNPSATLAAHGDGDELIATCRVSPGFKLNRASAAAWAAAEFVSPTGRHD